MEEELNEYFRWSFEEDEKHENEEKKVSNCFCYCLYAHLDSGSMVKLAVDVYNTSINRFRSHTSVNKRKEGENDTIVNVDERYSLPDVYRGSFFV